MRPCCCHLLNTRYLMPTQHPGLVNVPSFENLQGLGVNHSTPSSPLVVSATVIMGDI